MIKRVILGVIAVALILLGSGLGAAAIWAHGAFDSAGVIKFDAGTITPAGDARSTIIDVDRFNASVPYIGFIGTTRLSVATEERSDPTDTLFLGAASTPDVDSYIKGSAYSVASRVDGQWTTREVPGSLIPALPRDQSFWLVQDVGPSPAILVPGERPLTLLIMHPAGIPTGPLVLSIDFAVPNAGAWNLGIAIAGAVLLIAGALLLLLAIRMTGRRGKHALVPDAVTTQVVPVAEGAPQTPEQAVVEPAPEAVVEPAPEAVVEPAPEAVVEPAPEAVVEPAPEAVVEPALEAVVEPAPAPGDDTEALEPIDPPPGAVETPAEGEHAPD